MPDNQNHASARVRLVLPSGFAVGPGKADLLAAIDQAGSIAAAGRGMGMSYKRAWSLVESMNHSFNEPVVETTRGGSDKGGTRLTTTGKKVLEIYRSIERRTNDTSRAELAQLVGLMKTDELPETP